MWRFLCILALAGCNGPGPQFAGVPATRVEVAGSVFDVRVRGDMAEAVRINPQYAPRFGPIRARAGFVMAQVSGCRVREVLGDQAVAVGRLDCGGGPRAAPLPVPARYSCVDVSAWVNAGPGPDYPEFDCDPA